MAFEYISIPISTGKAQSWISVLGNNTYNFTLRWAGREEFGWWLDIYDENMDPLIMGIPLCTGVDLTLQYRHIFPYPLWLYSAKTHLPPGYNGLGSDIILMSAQ